MLLLRLAAFGLGFPLAAFGLSGWWDTPRYENIMLWRMIFVCGMLLMMVAIFS